MIAQDIALQRKEDGLDYPVISHGDFQIIPSDEQHILDIFESFPGWWKEFILVGVGIKSYIKSSGKEQEIQVNGALQLRADNYLSPSVNVNYNADGTLNVETNAVRG